MPGIAQVTYLPALSSQGTFPRRLNGSTHQLLPISQFTGSQTLVISRSPGESGKNTKTQTLLYFKDPDLCAAVVFQVILEHTYVWDPPYWDWPSHCRGSWNHLGKLLVLSTLVPRWFGFGVTPWVLFHVLHACGHGKAVGGLLLLSSESSSSPFPPCSSVSCRRVWGKGTQHPGSKNPGSRAFS